MINIINMKLKKNRSDLSHVKINYPEQMNISFFMILFIPLNNPIKQRILMIRGNRHNKTIAKREDRKLSYLYSHRENHEKIDELHTSMKTYFESERKKNIGVILPKIQSIENEISFLEDCLDDCFSLNSLDDEKKTLMKKKNILQGSIKESSKTLQKLKSKRKHLKVESEILSSQIETKRILLQKMKRYGKSKKVKKMKTEQSLTKRKSSIVKKPPRRQSILLAPFKKLKNADIIHSLQNEGSTVEKWRQIDALLELISVDQPTNSLQCLLTGDARKAIGQKVFKNYSCDTYFNELMKHPSVQKEFHKIQHILENS